MTMTCDKCPEPAAVFFPGDEENRCDLFLLRREVPLRKWCLSCFMREFGAKEATA